MSIQKVNTNKALLNKMEQPSAKIDFYFEISRALLFTMNVPKTFQLDKLQTIVFLINRIPKKVLDFKTPIKIISSPHLLLIPPLGAFMFILINLIGLNLILSLSSVFFWAMLLVRRIISIITLLLGNILSLQMLHFMRLFHFFLPPSLWSREVLHNRSFFCSTSYSFLLF